MTVRLIAGIAAISIVAGACKLDRPSPAPVFPNGLWPLSLDYQGAEPIGDGQAAIDLVLWLFDMPFDDASGGSRFLDCTSGTVRLSGGRPLEWVPPSDHWRCAALVPTGTFNVQVLDSTGGSTRTACATLTANGTVIDGSTVFRPHEGCTRVFEVEDGGWIRVR